MQSNNEKNNNRYEDLEDGYSFWSEIRDFYVKTLKQDENIKFYHAKGSKCAYIVKDGKTPGHLNLTTSNVPEIPCEFRADI